MPLECVYVGTPEELAATAEQAHHEVQAAKRAYSDYVNSGVRTTKAKRRRLYDDYLQACARWDACQQAANESRKG